MSAPASAYAGVRILDLSRILAGPYASLVLADLGAEIIKIESPAGGDDSRAFLPPGRDGVSAYFLCANRNKKSVAIDLKASAGRELLLALAEHSDVLIENFRSGVVERLGVDAETVRGRNPRLVYCSVSGYGREGSHGRYPGYDPVAQAESGLMSMSGERDGPPVRTGPALVDMVAGLHAAQAIAAALYHRRDSGEGQRIEVSLYDTGINMLLNHGAGYLLTGECPTRAGNGSQVAQPAGNYPTADGDIMLTVGSDRLFRDLCESVLGRPDLSADPRFATNSDRVENRAALDTALAAVLVTRPRVAWMERLREAGVPAGEIATVAEALESPLTAERGLVVDATHASLGTVRTIASPMRLTGTPVVSPRGAPRLGEHTDEVLDVVLGLDAARIAALREAGIVAGPDA